MEKYLFLGNPGTGKSTLINCLVGSPVFNSGVNYDGGLTKAFQKHIHDNVQYLDTPGLADRAIQDTAAEITEALKLSGTYKLFFMVRLESGRVVNDDLATIEVVLRSIQNDNVPFAIIVNNVKKRQYAKLKKNGGDYEEIAKMLHSIKYKTPHIVFIPVIDALDEEDNAITELPSDVEAFIRSEAPTVEIDPKTVQPIKIEDFHKVSEKLREMQENLLKENAVLERKIEQLSMEPHVGGGLLGTLGRLMALNPSRSTPKDQDNAQAKILTAGGFTKDSTMNETPPVLPESVDNPQWGEAFTSDSESENKSVVSTAGCLTNWIWAGFEMAKNFVKEQTKRWFGQFRRWWKPQQCKSESSDRDHLQGADSNSTSAYSQLSTFQDGITHGAIAHKTFAAAQGKTKVDLSAKDTVVDIPL